MQKEIKIGVTSLYKVRPKKSGGEEEEEEDGGEGSGKIVLHYIYIYIKHMEDCLYTDRRCFKFTMVN